MKNELNRRCIMGRDPVLPAERELTVYVVQVDIKSKIMPV